MLSLILATFLLGIAGLDPLGAILIASGIAAGLSRTKITIFTLCVFVFTVLTGVFFSYAGTNFISKVTSSIPDSNSPIWAYINIAIVIIILVWLYKKSQPSVKQKPKKKLAGSTWAITFAGVAFGVGAVFDPTFLAVISLASQSDNFFVILTMHTIWIIISQVLLFGLFIAYLFNKHEVVLDKSKMIWKRHKSRLSQIVYGAAILSIVVLLIDTMFFAFRGDYLLVFS